MAKDWSKFTKRVNIKASVEEIIAAWTTQTGLERWFLRKAEFTDLNNERRDPNSRIEKGDLYRWLWHGWGDETVQFGTIVQMNAKDPLEFTFGKAGIVKVLVKKEKEEIIVELVQEGIPTDEDSKINYHVGCSTGWTFYLANLKSVLEGGLDLRNKNTGLKDMVNS